VSHEKNKALEPRNSTRQNLWRQVLFIKVLYKLQANNNETARLFSKNKYQYFKPNIGIL
jgi:hypothetical protein